MSSTNGHGPKRAVLYARVSTEAQAGEDRYSLRQQIAALKEYTEAEGYEVLEEVQDAGYSGANLERPGLDRVRDLVEAGGVSLVVAQDADRITREPHHRMLLDEEFAKYGTRLVALDDWGDDTHEGELLRFMKGWVAKGERLKTAERSRRGKLRKAREGKVIADGAPNYGFRFNATHDGYEVDEEKMAVVRRIFDDLAGGSSINSLVASLKREGVPSPAGPPKSWSHSQIRNLVGFDVYKPHARDELEALYAEGLLTRDVLTSLDPNLPYGVWWYNRKKHSRQKSRDKKRPDGTYADVNKRALKDRAEWVAVPVSLGSAGVPRETFDRARARIAAGAGTRPSRAEGRFWELAGGGMLRCGECGGTMRARSVKRRKGREGEYTDFYYTCGNAFQKRGCTHTTLYRAPATEHEVMLAVDDVLADPDRITRDVEAAIQKEKRAARDPDAKARTLAETLERIAADREKLVRGYVTGRLRESEYDALAKELEDEESGVREELSRVQHSSARVRELEERRELLLRMFGTGLRLGLYWFPPHLRRGVYELMGLRVHMQAGGGITIEGDLDASVVRYSQEIAEYADKLHEVDERTREAPLEVVERELERLRASIESASGRTPTARARREVRYGSRRRASF